MSRLLIFKPHPRICLLILEREEGGEWDRNTDVREISVSCLPYVIWQGKLLF